MSSSWNMESPRISCINMDSHKAMKAQTQVIGKGGSQSSGSGPALQDSLNRIRSDQISELETVLADV